MIKGSPEAMAWSAKMKAARKKSQVRGAGLRMERKFFDRRGIFAMAGHVKHLENSGKKKFLKTHRLTNQEADALYQYALSLGSKAAKRYAHALYEYVLAGQHGLGPQWSQYGITLPVEQSIRKAFIKFVPALLHYDNPGSAWHEGMADAAQRGGARTREQIERVMYKGMEVAHRDSASAARVLGMNPTKRKLARVIRPRRVRKNPLAVFSLGNPPKRINTGIAGVVYSRCLEIRAEKLKFKPGLYRHPFSRKAGVQILALDNGDLLVHSTRGVNLWGPI